MPTAFADLSTPLVADACVRTGVPLRAAPAGIRAVVPGHRLAGRALPARHYGSVDVFLEAFGRAEPGDVLVVDNGDREDEGCIGDLTALEVARAGLAGIVIWGRHRDTAIVRSIPIALFSRGACARGPVRLDSREPDAFVNARIGDQIVTASDWVVADDDGAIFIDDGPIAAVVAAAESIRDTETQQTERMKAGLSLREQLRFADYLEARSVDPALDFRAHLRALNAAIEE